MLRTNRWGCSNIPDWLLLRRGGIPAPPAGTALVALVLLALLLEARGVGVAQCWWTWFGVEVQVDEEVDGCLFMCCCSCSLAL